MPFIKKHTGQGAPPFTPARSVFIGRTTELLFFVQQILKPEEPIHNLLSIWGQAGVGKTTLLHHFISQTRTAEFQEYCLTALVDERQATPASIMEKCAQQLPFSNKFEKALRRYKEALSLPVVPRPASLLQQTLVRSAPDLTGALLEGIPVAGPLLREGAKAATEQLLDRYHTAQERPDPVQLDGPLDTLTRVFITELNHLATTKGTLYSGRTKRERRILLFFDTFEQVADEVVPWLLHSVLELEIHPNIVFIIAGRDPIERAGPADPKSWLPYYEAHTLCAMPLHHFTQEETSAYLLERGMTSSKQQETIWQLSQGLPLYLGFLTTNAQGCIDPTKDVVDNFLRWIPHQEATKRQLALDAALFSQPFHLDDLEAFPYLSEQERPVLYEWLIRQPFVRASSLKGRYLYHDLAQELFRRYLKERSPKAYYTVRKALAEYYQRVLEQLRTVQEQHIYGPTEERLEVMLALVTQRFYLLEEASHLQALLPSLAILEYEDEEQMQALTKTLHDLVHIPSSTHLSAHASQIIQALLRFIETAPRLHSSVEQTQQQEWFQAKDHLLKLVSKASPSSEVLAGLYEQCGWGYLRFKEYQQALACFEHALALQPSYGPAYNGLGQTHYYLKEYQQAIDDHAHAQQLVPHHPHVYFCLGRTYLRIKAYQQALSNLDHAQQLDWRLAEIYHYRAMVYIALKEHHKALADLDHLLEVVPGHPLMGRIYLQRGCVYLWLNEPLQAAQCFTCGYEMASTGNLFSWRRNWSTITQDLFLWAREWSAMCQRHPDAQTDQRLEALAKGESYTACVCRGVIFWLHNEFEHALAALQHAATLRYDPDWQEFGEAFWQEWDAHFWGGMTYAMLDREEEARNAVEEALAREMPPILLKPLRWLAPEKPTLYQQYVKPLLTSYGVEEDPDHLSE